MHTWLTFQKLSGPLHMFILTSKVIEIQTKVVSIFTENIMQHPKKKRPKEITSNKIFNCLNSNIMKARTTGMHMLILTSLFLEIQTHSGGHETAQSWIMTACVSSLFRGIAWKIATRHWCMEDCNKHFSPLLASQKQEHNARIYIFSHRFVFMC